MRVKIIKSFSPTSELRIRVPCVCTIHCDSEGPVSVFIDPYGLSHGKSSGSWQLNRSSGSRRSTIPTLAPAHMANDELRWPLLEVRVCAMMN
jgi:hypothetical protein